MQLGDFLHGGLSNAASAAGGKVFGTATDPGILGTGHYTDWDTNSFKLQQLPAFQQAAAKGMMAQGQTSNNQNTLANMLMAQANGAGPNLATQQLQNATDANNRTAMSLAQSMPGGSNMATQRNILENQAMNNQQAAGQAGQLRGEQQLQAQSQLQGLLGQQQQGQQGWANIGLGADQSQMQALNNLEQLKQNSYYGAAGNSIGGKVIGGAISGAGSALGHADVGFAYGGPVSGSAGGDGYTGSQSSSTSGWTVPVADQSFSDGGYAMGLRHGHMLAMLMGGDVPGKARVDGDSSKNDTVSAKLSPGEIVLPRSVTQDDDAAEKAKLFVEAIRKKKY